MAQMKLCRSTIQIRGKESNEGGKNDKWEQLHGELERETVSNQQRFSKKRMKIRDTAGGKGVHTLTRMGSC